MGRINVKGIVVASVGLLMITGLFIALFSNGWYYINDKRKIKYEGYYDYYDYEYDTEKVYYFGLSEVEEESRRVDEDGDVDKDKDSWDYDELEFYGQAEDADGLFNMATLVFILTLVGTIIAFGFVTLGFLAGFRLIPGWIPLIVGIVASSCIMLGPIYMIPASPNAWDESLRDNFDDGDNPQEGPWDSFWGSDSDSNEDGYLSVEWDNSWGPGWAWYLSFTLGIMMLGASLSYIGIRRIRLGYGRPRGYYGYGQYPGRRFDPHHVDRGPAPGRRPSGHPERHSMGADYGQRGRKTYPPPPVDDYSRDIRGRNSPQSPIRRSDQAGYDDDFEREYRSIYGNNGRNKIHRGPQG